jgi:hypothetical protein
MIDWVIPNGKTVEIISPLTYLPAFLTELDTYIEPYKSINVYHAFQLPDLVYFAIDLTYEIFSNYQNKEIAIIDDIKNKLVYLFSTDNVNFGQIIDFKDIEDKIYDLTIQSETDSFSNLKGMKFCKIRDIYTTKDPIYEENTTQDYPVYLTDEIVGKQNTLRAFKLGPGQYPMFVIDGCEISKD